MPIIQSLLLNANPSDSIINSLFVIMKSSDVASTQSSFSAYLHLSIVRYPVVQCYLPLWHGNCSQISHSSVIVTLLL